MRRRAPIIAAIVGVAIAGLVVVLGLSSPGDADQEDSPIVGGLAPELAGATMDGGRFDIDDHRGQWVLVNFFATWCPPCVEEHPELVEFSERNRGAVQVVTVADTTEIDRAEQFFAENGGDWPVIVDGGDGASLDYGVKKLPESFLVAPSGEVAVKIAGGVTVGELEGLVASGAGDGS